jgi:hypothetical protein
MDKTDSMDVSDGQDSDSMDVSMDKIAFHRKLKMIFEKSQRSVSDSRVYLLLA